MAHSVSDNSFRAHNNSEWHGLINKLVCQADVSTFRNPRFSGVIRNSDLGALQILEVESEREYGVRDRRHINGDCNESVVLVLVKSGSLEIQQLGRTAILAPLTFAIYDLNTPYTYKHADRAEVIAVKIPYRPLFSNVSSIGRFVGRTFSAKSGCGLITANFLVSVCRESRRLTKTMASRYGSQIVDLVEIMLSNHDDRLPIAHSAVQSAFFRRCVAEMRVRITDAILILPQSLRPWVSRRDIFTRYSNPRISRLENSCG